MKQGIFVYGVINGIAEKPYDFMTRGERVQGVSCQIRVLIGEQSDAFGESEKIYAFVKVPQTHWDRLKADAIRLTGKRVVMRVNPDSYQNGTAFLRATGDTELAEENEKGIKAA